MITHPTFADLKKGMTCEAAWTDDSTGHTEWSRAILIDSQPDQLMLYYPDTQEEEALRRVDWQQGTIRDAHFPVLDTKMPTAASKIAQGVLHACVKALNSPCDDPYSQRIPKVTLDEWVRKVNAALMEEEYTPNYSREKLQYWLKNQSYRHLIQQGRGMSPPSRRQDLRAREREKQKKETERLAKRIKVGGARHSTIIIHACISLTSNTRMLLIGHVRTPRWSADSFVYYRDVTEVTVVLPDGFSEGDIFAMQIDGGATSLT
jgi:hypothetical protein